MTITHSPGGPSAARGPVFARVIVRHLAEWPRQIVAHHRQRGYGLRAGAHAVAAR